MQSRPFPRSSIPTTRYLLGGGILAWLILSLAQTVLCAGKPLEPVVEDLDVYQYRMKGNVRLLFFWVGKDDVGGGTIALSRRVEPQTGTRAEEIEVLFGSTPERVPGGINRWGFGTERSIWEATPNPSAFHLKETVFEGFMRHSGEDSLSQVQSNSSSEKGTGLYWYDGIRSQVRPNEALSEIRIFSAREDFDYRSSETLRCSYQSVLSAPPDRIKRLPRESSPPYGFLTAVKRVIDDLIRDFSSGRSRRPPKMELEYYYNGNAYRLELQKARQEQEFVLPLRKNEGQKNQPVQTFSDVVKAEFRIVRLRDNNDHEFTLWFPLQGPYRGVPLRIVDKPRWWLRVELNLEPGAEEKALQMRLARDLQACR